MKTLATLGEAISGELLDDETLLQAVDSALADMSWLTAADRGAVALARTYARRIDDALEYAEGQEVTKALYLGPHLLNALRALGGTPDARGESGGNDKGGATATRLEEFRKRANERKGA